MGKFKQCWNTMIVSEKKYYYASQVSLRLVGWRCIKENFKKNEKNTWEINKRAEFSESYEILSDAEHKWK